MKFSILALALPAVAFAQTTLSTIITPTSTEVASVPSTTAGPPDYSACEEQASGYADLCPRCDKNCAGSSVYDQCIYSVFFTINYYQAQCEQRGGQNCRGRAADMVCPVA